MKKKAKTKRIVRSGLDYSIITWTIFFLLLVTLDLGTTIYAVGYHGAQEGNPLADCMIKQMGIWPAMISLFVLQFFWYIMATMLVLNTRKLRKAYLVVLILGSLLRAIVVANNFGVIFYGLR